MSKAKHTPGPWYLNEPNGIVYAGEDKKGSHTFCVAVAYPVKDQSPSWPRDRSNQVANARLISLAPDMLQFVRDIAEAHPNSMIGEHTPILIEKAKSLISRAESTGEATRK